MILRPYSHFDEENTMNKLEGFVASKEGFAAQKIRKPSETFYSIKFHELDRTSQYKLRKASEFINKDW